MYVRLQKCPAAGYHLYRETPYEILKDRDIVGRKTPEDVFFGSYRPQIQPVAVDILKLAYLPIFNQFLYLSDSGMEKEKVTYHQVYVVFFGKFFETHCF